MSINKLKKWRYSKNSRGFSMSAIRYGLKFFKVFFLFFFLFSEGRAVRPIDISVENLWTLPDKEGQRPLSSTRKSQFTNPDRVSEVVEIWRAMALEASSILADISESLDSSRPASPGSSDEDDMFQMDEELSLQSLRGVYDLVNPSWLEKSEAFRKKIAGTPHKYGEDRSGLKHTLIPFQARYFVNYVMLSLAQIDYAYYHGKKALILPGLDLAPTEPVEEKEAAAWAGDQRNFVSTPAYIMENAWDFLKSNGLKPDIAYWSVQFYHTNSRTSHSRKAIKRLKRQGRSRSLPSDFKYTTPSVEELFVSSDSEGHEQEYVRPSSAEGGISAERGKPPKVFPSKPIQINPKKGFRKNKGGASRSADQRVGSWVDGVSLVSRRDGREFRKAHPIDVTEE